MLMQRKKINQFISHDKKLLALGLCDYSVFKRWSGLQSNNDLTFGEFYGIHVKMLKKDNLLSIKNNVNDFLREYVDEFERENTENIVEQVT